MQYHSLPGRCLGLKPSSGNSSSLSSRCYGRLRAQSFAAVPISTLRVNAWSLCWDLTDAAPVHNCMGCVVPTREFGKQASAEAPNSSIVPPVGGLVQGDTNKGSKESKFGPEQSNKSIEGRKTRTTPIRLLELLFGVSGTLCSMILRLELYSSGNRIIPPENQNFYNLSFTLHGLFMIFFLVMPGLYGGFGNYL